MIKGIYHVSGNMHYKVNNMEIVANNLANINTTGFKRELPFSEMMERFQNTGVNQLTDFSQGNLLLTSNPLDFAITGNAQFVLKTENGLEFTRNGSFKISEEGFLVNEQGHKVLGKKGAIDFIDYKLNKEQSISVSKNGEIKIGDQVIDDLLLVKVENSSGLSRVDGLNFQSFEDSYTEIKEGEAEIQQGYLEESNVNPVLELQAMIDINKEFEASQKMINFLDQSLEKANEIGRV